MFPTTLLRRFSALAVATACIVPGAAMAAGVSDDWRVEVSQDRCIASQDTAAGLFELNGLDGDVGFALFGPRGVNLPQGMQGVLEIDTRRIMFTPSYTDEGDALYFDGALSGVDLGALRAARDIRLTVDGQYVVAFIAGPGLPKGLDGLIACSRGKRGPWGVGPRPQR
jgi:hypothetical protein